MRQTAAPQRKIQTCRNTSEQKLWWEPCSRHYKRCSWKTTRQMKRKKHSLKTEQVSEPDVAGILELSDWEFKTTTITVLRALMDKVDRAQRTGGWCEQRDGSPRKELKEPLKIKTKPSVTCMKNAFDGPASRLDMAEERISELEDTMEPPYQWVLYPWVQPWMETSGKKLCLYWTCTDFFIVSIP